MSSSSYQEPITKYFNSTKKSPDVPPNKANNTEHNKEQCVTIDDINEKVDKLLKNFDLNWNFGPCSGISRLDRWERASKFSLNPPREIKELLLKNRNNLNYILCIWDQNALLRPVIPEHYELRPPATS